MMIAELAKICHQANKAYCESLKDYSQLEWKDAPAWQKESAINGVMFAIKNPLSNPIDSHESWMREKVANGWVYGPVKDAEKKTHPCICAYHELPLKQRLKDDLFLSIVRV